MEVLGAPSKTVQEMSPGAYKFFDERGRPFIMDDIKGDKKYLLSKPLEMLLETDDSHFIDFVRRCLDWNPLTRLTPDQALRHIWILEGLPKNVLKHHCQMYEIDPSEIPEHLLQGTGLETDRSKRQKPSSRHTRLSSIERQVGINQSQVLNQKLASRKSSIAADSSQKSIP